jgi:predicted cupin superfamily sugar epimerase
LYCLVAPNGDWHELVLGPDGEAGQRVAFTCPGGWWKSSHLPAGGECGLIREIVTPGFDYADHRFADLALFAELFPQHRARWAPYVLVDAAQRPGGGHGGE